jgi:DNA-binding NarL/FixJ family response regulator
VPSRSPEEHRQNSWTQPVDVAALIIEGRSSNDIAASLFLSPRTVRDHIKAIFGKVGVHDRRHLTAALTGQPGEATA